MHLTKVAAYAALVATVSAARPGAVNEASPTLLQKRAIVELNDGQLNSGGGDTVQQIPDGQIIAGDKTRVQQVPDGQIQAPKTKQQEPITTVVNFVTETVPLEPITRFITVTGSSNNTSNATMAAPLPPYANTTQTTEAPLTTFQSSRVMFAPSTVTPFANTTETETKTKTVEITAEASTKVVVVSQAPFSNGTADANEQPTYFPTGGMNMGTGIVPAPPLMTGTTASAPPTGSVDCTPLLGCPKDNIFVVRTSSIDNPQQCAENCKINSRCVSYSVGIDLPFFDCQIFSVDAASALNPGSVAREPRRCYDSFILPAGCDFRRSG